VLVLDEEHTLTILSTAWRWRELDGCDGKEVWFAGDPRSHGVASTPGGSHLLMARAPRWASRRERLRSQALAVAPLAEAEATRARP
jgi:hypothetical protein